jgi:hypothetical protein
MRCERTELHRFELVRAVVLLVARLAKVKVGKVEAVVPLADNRRGEAPVARVTAVNEGRRAQGGFGSSGGFFRGSLRRRGRVDFRLRRVAVVLVVIRPNGLVGRVVVVRDDGVLNGPDRNADGRTHNAHDGIHHILHGRGRVRIRRRRSSRRRFRGSRRLVLLLLLVVFRRAGLLLGVPGGLRRRRGTVRRRRSLLGTTLQSRRFFFFFFAHNHFDFFHLGNDLGHRLGLAGRGSSHLQLHYGFRPDLQQDVAQVLSGANEDLVIVRVNMEECDLVLLPGGGVGERVGIQVRLERVPLQRLDQKIRVLGAVEEPSRRRVVPQVDPAEVDLSYQFYLKEGEQGG